MSHAAPPPPRPRPPAGQSMALLTELTEHPLERAYEDRARRRRAHGEPGSRGTGSLLTLVAMLVLGLLLAVAAQTLRLPAEAAGRQHRQVVDQVQRQQRAVDGKQRTATSLRDQISDAGRTAVGGSADPRAQQLARVELAAGAVPVTGPGFVLTLDDRAGAAQQSGSGPRSGGGSPTITSSDLQQVVNGLWQAGAEAIAVNGHRLTSQSAIRFAGQAILVDYRPLARPYAIAVIGGPQTRSSFDQGLGGQYVGTLKRTIKVSASTEDRPRVDLPAASSLVLHSARPAGSSAGSAPSESTP